MSSSGKGQFWSHEKSSRKFLAAALGMSLPRYMKYFMLIKMNEITIYNGVQYSISMVILYMSSVYTDMLRKRYSTPNVRKLMYIVPLAVFIIGN